MSRARAGAAISAVLMIAALGTAAAEGGTRAASPHSSSRGAPKLVHGAGGTVTYAVDQVPTTLNDHSVAGNTAATRQVASAVWPQVFQVGPDHTPVLNTAVVTSAELVSLNPQTVVYQIDPRATWSDGVPISVQDFLYAWEMQRGGASDVDGAPASVASTLGYRDISSITGSNGGRTVTVVFRAPFGDWASLFDDLLPAHIAQRVGWNSGFDTFDRAVLVSGGPWQVASWQPGSRMVLTRNPRWWGPVPQLDQIVLETAPAPQNVSDTMRSGGADIAYPSQFDAGLLGALTSDPALETSQSLGTTMLQLVFNTRHPPLDAAPVRQGIAHAIDRAKLVTDLIQPLNPIVWEDNNHLFANAQPQYADNAAAYVRPDLSATARLFSQAGLSANSTGTWTSHGTSPTLQFVWAADDPWSAAVAPVIAAELTTAGLDVSSDPVTSEQLAGSVLPTGAFDLALAPISASAYPTATLGSFTSSPALTSPGTNVDWSGFDDPHIDSLMVQAVETLGSNQADPIYQQVDQDLWTQMPTLPLFAEPTLVVHAASVKQVDDDPGGLGPMYWSSHWYRLVAAPRKG